MSKSNLYNEHRQKCRKCGHVQRGPGFKPPPAPGYFRPSQIHALFGVNAPTIRAHIIRGNFPGSFKDKSGEWWIPRDALMQRIMKVFPSAPVKGSTNGRRRSP